MPIETQLIIAAATCFFSFIVQSSFYPFYKLTNPNLIREHKTVFSYLSGVIGDGLLVPLTNVFAVQTLINIPASLVLYQLLIPALFIGALLTSIVHYNQQKQTLLNWTMPQKGKWNTLGLYHALFMFSEISFLAYVLFVQIAYSLNYGPSSFIQSPIIFALLALIAFLLTFIFDYRKTAFRNFAKVF